MPRAHHSNWWRFSRARASALLDVGGLADDLVGGQFVAEGVLQAVLDEVDGQVGDVDADPAALQAFGHGHRGAAAAEGVQDHVAFVAAGPDDALQQGFRLLGGVAEAFFGLGIDGWNISPRCPVKDAPCTSSKYRLYLGHSSLGGQ